MEASDDILARVVKAIADGHTPLLPEDVDALLTRYPYFTLPGAIMLRQKESAREIDDSYDALRHRVALASPDSDALGQLLTDDGLSGGAFYPDQTPAKPSTETVIETFLNTYGTTSPQEEATIEKMIFNPTPDYAQLLAQEEEKSLPESGIAPAGSNDDLINRFIISQKHEDGSIPATPPIPKETVDNRVADKNVRPKTDDSLLSESLAKIFIKQGQYKRALEIIEQLNLNYPEKSIYFADQMRFLRKLIVIRDIKNNNKETL